MINLYSGTPGSGKSLHQAMDIYYALKYGRPVVANFEIDPDFVSSTKGVFKYVPNDELTPDLLRSFSREYFQSTGRKPKEGWIKVYIDECQILFNARSWNAADRSDWNSFFSNHRKYFMDIYLIAQFDRMIDRQIRSLIEYEYIHRKMSNFGIWGKLISLLFGGTAFVSVKRWYPLREKVSSEVIRCRKKWLRIYDTYKTFDAKTSLGIESPKALTKKRNPVGTKRTDSDVMDAVEDVIEFVSDNAEEIVDSVLA